MISWSKRLDAAVRRVAGPEDDVDLEVNGDPDSTLGEDDESGFDESPIEAGWEDESDEDEDEDEC